MPLVYVDDETHITLKEMSAREGRPIVAILRRFVRATDLIDETDEIGPMDAVERWEWTKKRLGIKCGCVFNDVMEVFEVKDWGLFRTINNGKLMEKYLSLHPEERDKYSGVVAEVKQDEQLQE